ncbi:heme ABC superfamily ATP binding cassette transporter, binding protein [Centipeda periodontii DSM 2778]|uniref:Heme ABC superfamily ATP binding cassette transporter, binding protein n=1 Tax=Centipeda periodontii DSM 2778 TaxID=888060 RepID=F5RNZ7_9FIRM|nr:ABC transporter substrate-binding protein [Centipeda periodontii]EGK58387.1 heme ABC superfamily ATP binding cassette transporter, binding protein [Centipeda periodontii DSM 2778]
MRRHMRALAALTVIFAALLIGGCINSSEQQAGGYQITDVEGTVVTFEHKPQRILTVSAGTDELMLGLVEPERMAAINESLADREHTNIPWVCDRIPTVIPRSPSVEQIAALHPDLVVVTPWMPRENIDAIRELNVPVLVCKSAATMEDIHDNIRLYAAAVGEVERGEKLIGMMEEKLAEIRAKVEKVPEEKKHKSIALISIMVNYGGAGCTFDELCRYTDSINAKAAAGNRMGQEMTKEQLVAANPDYLFFPSYEDGATNEENYGRQYLEDPSLAQMTAVRERQIGHPWARYVYNLSQDIVYGIQETAWILYGDEFKQSRHEFLTAVE